MSHPEWTALRETEEEVGISSEMIRLVGRLPEMWTATGYRIEPMVGILNSKIEEITLRLEPLEIAEVVWAPLEVLMSPGVYQSEKFQVGETSYPIDVYNYRHYRIWGATGSMTKNLLDRINEVVKKSNGENGCTLGF
jgi:hypothetical protein